MTIQSRCGVSTIMAGWPRSRSVWVCVRWNSGRRSTHLHACCQHPLSGESVWTSAWLSRHCHCHCGGTGVRINGWGLNHPCCWLVTHAGIAAVVGRAFRYGSKRKTAWAVKTKLGTHILCSTRSACIDPEVKRSRSHSYKNCHSRTVSDACCYICVLPPPAWVCMSIRLPMFTSCTLYCYGVA